MPRPPLTPGRYIVAGQNPLFDTFPCQARGATHLSRDNRETYPLPAACPPQTPPPALTPSCVRPCPSLSARCTTSPPPRRGSSSSRSTGACPAPTGSSTSGATCSGSSSTRSSRRCSSTTGTRSCTTRTTGAPQLPLLLRQLFSRRSPAAPLRVRRRYAMPSGGVVSRGADVCPCGVRCVRGAGTSWMRWRTSTSLSTTGGRTTRGTARHAGMISVPPPPGCAYAARSPAALIRGARPQATAGLWCTRGNPRWTRRIYPPSRRRRSGCERRDARAPGVRHPRAAPSAAAAAGGGRRSRV